MKILAALEDPFIIRKILTHLGIPAQPPPRTPARYDPNDEADLFATN